RVDRPGGNGRRAGDEIKERPTTSVGDDARDGRSAAACGGWGGDLYFPTSQTGGRSARNTVVAERRRRVDAGGFTFTGHAINTGRAVAKATPLTVLMVDYNLINSLGNIDDEINAAVATALGDAADDISKLVSGDEVQDFTPGAIIK